MLLVARFALVLLITVPAVGLCRAAAAQEPPPQLATQTQQQLDCAKVLTQQERAWNAGDLDGFAKGYRNSPDTLFITTSITRGYRVMLEDYRRQYSSRESMGELTYSEVEVRPLDDRFAVVFGKYHLERSRKAGGSADGLFTLTMEKTDQGWKIIIDHTT
jgi:uncharacterized protein (TIGR02246 family)